MKRLGSLLVLTLFFLLLNQDIKSIPEGLLTKLTGNNWRIAMATINPELDTNGTTLTDLLILDDSCHLDNLLGFSTDSLVVFADDTIPCDSAVNFLFARWYFQNDSNELVVVINDSLINTFEILLLNDDSLMVAEQRTIDSTQYTLTYTYLSTE